MIPRNPYSRKDGCSTWVGHAETHRWQAVHLLLKFLRDNDPGGEIAFFRITGTVLSLYLSMGCLAETVKGAMVRKNVTTCRINFLLPVSFKTGGLFFLNPH
jgi:hypothetical protein